MHLKQTTERGAGKVDRASRPLRDAADAGRPAVRSLYIHIPFCFHKCHYCDFYSIVDSRDRQSAFTDRLCAELRSLAAHADPAGLDTLFVGGGTPTLLRPDLWARLLATLHERYTVSPNTEFTVECNPETASEELFSILQAGGVNRISIGAQSFNADHLKTLERWHDPETVPRALELARDAGVERRSVDLIYAVPGQTLADWQADLERATALPVDHVSAYCLTYEPNTAMTKRKDLGGFVPASEDLEADMHQLTLDRLSRAGFARYEVSNFARDTPAGGACAHNLAYWRQQQWLAAGPSASAHLWAGPTGRAGSWRYKNVPRLGGYLEGGAQDPSDPHPPIVDVERPDPRRLIAERIMMGLRLADGLDAGPILEDLAFQQDATDRLADDAGRAVERVRVAVQRMRSEGLLEAGESSEDHWTLTDRGFMLCDWVASRLIDGLDYGT